MKSLCLAVGFLAGSLCLTAPARADVGEGVRLLRQARQSLEQGDAEAALVLLDQAYVELPFSAEEELVYHERADAYAAEGRYDEALNEYGKALQRPSAHRARFNSGVLQSRQAEEALEAAGVPLDPAGIPADADPAPLIEAIEQNMPRLEEARLQFMEALRLSPEAEARESVAALTARLDDLAEMLEELRQREQEDEQNDEGDEDQDDEKKDQDQQDKDDSSDEQEPSKDGDQDEQNQDDPQQDPADQDQPDDQQPPEPQEQTTAQPRPELSAAEVADLMEELEELEAMAMELDRQRRAQEQADVEKDW